MHETPVERFLGHVDPAHGPFGLLGLRPADYDPELIREALRSRLAQLSRHRQAASTEADEVRLALHVAAAQLCDDQVRRALLARQGVPSDAGPFSPRRIERADTPRAPTPEAPTPRTTPGRAERVGVLSTDEFRSVVLRVLAHSGGWNELAKRRLGGVAHAYGLDMDRLREALSDVATHSRRASDAMAPPGARARNTPHEPRNAPGALAAPISGRSRNALIGITALLFLLSFLMGIRLLSLLFVGPGPAPERTVEVALPGAQDAPAPDPGADERVASATSLTLSTGRPESDTPQAPMDLLEELRGANAALRDAPAQATAAFVRILGVVGARWPEIDAPTLQALRVEFVSFQQAAIRTDRNAALGVAEAIAAPAEPLADGQIIVDRDALTRATFAAGLMARLNRDDLISSIGSRFRGILARLSRDGGGARRRDFWPGVTLGLEGAADQLITGARDDAWRTRVGRGWASWIEQAERVGAEEPALGETLLLETIERMLVEGPDPSMSQAAHDAVSRLVAMLDFVGEEGGASERLVMWFDDPRVPTSALSLVTSRIVFGSLIPGFGPEMMLRPDASEAARQELRDDYALKLGISVSGDDRAVADFWRVRAREVLGARRTNVDPVGALERAAVLAMLNESASQRWAGEDEDALATARGARETEILEDAGAMVEAMVGKPVQVERLTAPSRSPDGQWARRYLAAMRNAGVRQELLNELRNDDDAIRGPVDADVLAEAACYGVPVPLRRSAQQVVERFRDDPYIVNALLEAMPNAARTPDVSQMIAGVTGRSIPSTNDPQWRATVRRALLERMAEMLARQRLPIVEALEMAIRETYEDRVAAGGALSMMGAGASGSGGGVSVAGASVAELASALRDTVVAHAQRFSEGQWTFTPLHELERRHGARRRLARGRLQEFAAAQLGLTEALAYVVAAERTSQAGEVRLVLDGLSESRRQATHVFHQIEAGEEAMLRLWLIRLGEEDEL